MKKILFISHSASRAGAQLLLLQTLKYIKDNCSEIEAELLLVKNGALNNEFSKYCKVYEWEVKFPNSIIKKLYNRLHQYVLIYRIRRMNYSLLYSNTIMNGYILGSLDLKGIPVITHVHEMDYWINKSGQDNLTLIKKYSDKFIAASTAVRDVLINKLNIDNKKIEVIYEYTSNKIKKSNKSIKNKLKIDKNFRLIGGCGAETWRKGKDLFIDIANETLMNNKEIDIAFVWIGGKLTNEIKKKHQMSPFSSQIYFVDHIEEASSYFHEFEIFCMTSREDPFPVVNLEFGIRGIPVIGFKDSGGTAELLKDQSEMLIENWDIILFAKRINELLNNENERLRLGESLSSNIKNNYTDRIIIPKIITKINNNVKNSDNYS